MKPEIILVLVIILGAVAFLLSPKDAEACRSLSPYQQQMLENQLLCPKGTLSIYEE